MDTREICRYLLEQMEILVNENPSVSLAKELAESYVKLVKHHKTCISSTEDSTTYDPSMIAALGTIALLSTREIQH